MPHSTPPRRDPHSVHPEAATSTSPRKLFSKQIPQTNTSFFFFFFFFLNNLKSSIHVSLPHCRAPCPLRPRRPPPRPPSQLTLPSQHRPRPQRRPRPPPSPLSCLNQVTVTQNSTMTKKKKGVSSHCNGKADNNDDILSPCCIATDSPERSTPAVS